MTRETRVFLIENVVRPIGLPFYWAARGLFWLFFGGLNKRRGRKAQKRLARDIETALPFLFSTYRGHVVPNVGVRFPEPFDYATVTVATDHLFLRFIRGRDLLGAHVARVSAPNDWHELPVVMSVLNGAQDNLERQSFAGLQEAAALLEPNLGRLKAFFDSPDYERNRQQLTEFHKRDRAAMREWEAEMNARLRGR